MLCCDILKLMENIYKLLIKIVNFLINMNFLKLDIYVYIDDCESYLII